jgi:hypothetical protein
MSKKEKVVDTAAEPVDTESADTDLVQATKASVSIDVNMTATNLADDAIATLERTLRAKDTELGAKHSTVSKELADAQHAFNKFATTCTVTGKDIPAQLQKVAKAAAALDVEVRVSCATNLSVVGAHYEPPEGEPDYPEGKVLAEENYSLRIYDEKAERCVEHIRTANMGLNLAADYTTNREGTAEEQEASDKLTKIEQLLNKVTTVRLENRKRMQDMPYYERQIKAGVSAKIMSSNKATAGLQALSRSVVTDILGVDGGDALLLEE